MPTQAALYDDLAADLHLSWSEAELPERERTKHVHRLHPYLGKFVPQLVEALLDRYVRPGGRVLDPFAGSGTTLVQCLESGYDAVGVDVAAFNCLLMRVKTSEYDPFRLETELRDALARRGRSRARPTQYVARLVRSRAQPPSSCTSARSLDELRARRRPARRARAGRALRAAHDPLRPRLPASAAARAVLVPQAPTDLHSRAGGRKFLARYLLDTLERLKAFQRVRTRGRSARSCTATRPRSRSRSRSTRSSPRRRTRASSTTTSSIVMPTRSSGSTTVASGSSAPLPRARAGARSRATSPASRRCSRAARGISPTARPCSSSSTTAETCIRRSSGAAGSGSTTGSNGTSTAERDGARASTSSRFWSVYEKRKRSVASARVDRNQGSLARRHEKGVYDMRKLCAGRLRR